MNIRHSKKFDAAYMEIAQVIAKLSYCNRDKVGAILVKDHRIIAEGYNGTPSGFENKCEDQHFKITEVSMLANGQAGVGGKTEYTTKEEVLHAESNALMKIAKSTNTSEGATLYTTLSPCIECAKLLIQAGIVRVIYAQMYHNIAGIQLLRKAHIECIPINAALERFEIGDTVTIVNPDENEKGVYEVKKVNGKEPCLIAELELIPEYQTKLFEHLSKYIALDVRNLIHTM